MPRCNNSVVLTFEKPAFSATEITALLSLAKENGVEESVVLRAADLDKDTLEHGTARISLHRQYLAQQAIASKLPNLVTLLGQRLRPTTYGIAGYALLSCPTLQDAIQFAKKYAPLLNLKFSLELFIEENTACLRLHRCFEMEQPAFASFLSLELTKLKVLLTDILCGSFALSEVTCSSAAQAYTDALADVLGVPVLYSDTINSNSVAEIRFEANLLKRRLPMSHHQTHISSANECDTLVTNFSSSYDLERHIKDLFRRSLKVVPTFSDIAKSMCMSQRTLRRRLEDLNTSYKRILDEVRKELAIEYVTTTHYTTETIAALLGYSEAPNFRHAFKRWTGSAPRRFANRGRLHVSDRFNPSKTTFFESHTQEEQKGDASLGRAELEIRERNLVTSA